MHSIVCACWRGWVCVCVGVWGSQGGTVAMATQCLYFRYRMVASSREDSGFKACNWARHRQQHTRRQSAAAASRGGHVCFFWQSVRSNMRSSVNIKHGGSQCSNQRALHARGSVYSRDGLKSRRTTVAGKPDSSPHESWMLAS